MTHHRISEKPQVQVAKHFNTAQLIDLIALQGNVSMNRL